MEKFYLKEFDTDAAMVVVGEKCFRVLKGSKAEFRNIRPSFEKAQKKYFNERKLLINSGALKLVDDVYISTRDIDFDCVSAASCVFLGRSSSGQTEWEDEHGVPFNGRKVFLNDLLQFSGDDLARARIKFNQIEPNGGDPWIIYQDNPERINHDWLFWHKEIHYFNAGQIAICLVKMPNGNWLLTTIKEVTKRLGKTDEPNYEGHEIERFRHLFGKVVVKYGKGHTQQGLTFEKAKSKLEVVQNHSHRRMLFAHVAWMERYNGLKNGDKPQGGGEYGERGDDAEIKHEIYNFSNNGGRCYGFVEPPQKSKNNQIKLERIDRFVDDKCESIDGVTVVFVAKHPDEAGLKMVGFYQSATVFRGLKHDVTSRWIVSVGKDVPYNLSCDFEDAYWLPNEHRVAIESIGHISRPTVIYPTEEMQDEASAYIEQLQKEQVIDSEPTQVKTILSKMLTDDEITVVFDRSRIKVDLPTGEVKSHDYTPTKTSGTSLEGVKKIRSGRKAEKYFVEFLKANGFKQGKDFADVANDKKFGYDIKFGHIGIEIKNIQCGGLYLSDNEIGQLEKGITRLVLVAVDKGIWVLNSDSAWLTKTIADIRAIRGYCESNYTDIDLTDIKININARVENESREISLCVHDEITEAFDIGRGDS